MVHKEELRKEVDWLLRKAEKKCSMIDANPRSTVRTRGHVAVDWDTLPMLSTLTAAASSSYPRKAAKSTAEREGIHVHDPMAQRDPQLSTNVATTPNSTHQGSSMTRPAPAQRQMLFAKRGSGMMGARMSICLPLNQELSFSKLAASPVDNGERKVFQLARTDSCREHLNQAFKEAMDNDAVDKWLREFDAKETKRRRDEIKQIKHQIETNLKTRAINQKSQEFIGVAKSIEELDDGDTYGANSSFDRATSLDRGAARTPEGLMEESEYQRKKAHENLNRYLKLTQPGKYLNSEMSIKSRLGN